VRIKSGNSCRSYGISSQLAFSYPFMDDVQQTLDKFQVPQPEQDELKAIVESTRDAIVVAPFREGPETTTG
jgi:hypothetical protein